MSDLIAFLTARLDEDEAAARAAAGCSPCETDLTVGLFMGIHHRQARRPARAVKEHHPMTTQTISSAVAKREAGPVSLMWKSKTHFDAILPGHVEVRGFLGTAAAALYGNDKLMEAAEASPDSLITALMRCAVLGHQPGTDEFYLTPRMDHGRPRILGIEGYRGIVERMYRSGAVSKVVVREVCASDKFSYVDGRDDKPLHEVGGSGTTGGDFFGPAGSRDRGAMVGVYAYAELTTGAVSRVVLLSRDDVLAARDAGGYKPDDQYSPWNRLDAGKDHPEFQGRAMWWKTAARRLEPWVPTSAEYRREQLRAAAAASDGAAGRASAPPPAGPVPAAEPEIRDAVIVEDRTDWAGKAEQGSARMARQDAESEQLARSARPTGAQLGKLGRLLVQLGLSSPEGGASTRRGCSARSRPSGHASPGTSP